MPKGHYASNQRTTWRLAAKRIGITLEEYTRNRLAGLRWCYACRRWRAPARFGRDKHRPQKIDGTCIECRKLLDDARGDRRALRRRRELELENGGAHGVRSSD